MLHLLNQTHNLQLLKVAKSKKKQLENYGMAQVFIGGGRLFYYLKNP